MRLNSVQDYLIKSAEIILIGAGVIIYNSSMASTVSDLNLKLLTFIRI